MPSGLLHLPPPAHPFCLTLLPQRQPCPGPIRTLCPAVEVRPTDRARHRAQARLPPQWQGAMAPLGQPGQMVVGSTTLPHHVQGEHVLISQPPVPAGSACCHLTGQPHLSGKSPQIHSRAVALEGCERRGDTAPQQCSARTEGSAARGRRKQQHCA